MLYLHLHLHFFLIKLGNCTYIVMNLLMLWRIFLHPDELFDIMMYL